jgi:hypothetical protein
MIGAGRVVLIAVLTAAGLLSLPVEVRGRAGGSEVGGVIASRVVRALKRSDYLEAERRLSDLGYWMGKVDGRWDEASRHGLIAFQKVEGLRRTGSLTLADFDRLQVAERPRALLAGTAHIEVDLVRQVLFVVAADGKVGRIIPISSGSGKRFVSQGWARDAITHPGWYTVDRKARGWNRSPLGLLYYPIYFMWGTAIHGAPAVPTRPDSHGCVRIPVAVARSLYESTPIGMPVVVHRGGLPPRPPAVLMPVVESMTEIERG